MVFDDLSLGWLFQSQQGAVADLEAGDELHIAWIEDQELQMDAFEVDKVEMGRIRPSAEIHNDSYEACLITGMSTYFFAKAPSIEAFEEQMHPTYLTLGVSTSHDGLALELIIGLIRAGAPPELAVDFVVPRFGIEPSVWADTRGIETEEVEERLELFDQLSDGDETPAD